MSAYLAFWRHHSAHKPSKQPIIKCKWVNARPVSEWLLNLMLFAFEMFFTIMLISTKLNYNMFVCFMQTCWRLCQLLISMHSTWTIIDKGNNERFNLTIIGKEEWTLGPRWLLNNAKYNEYIIFHVFFLFIWLANVKYDVQ